MKKETKKIKVPKKPRNSKPAPPKEDQIVANTLERTSDPDNEMAPFYFTTSKAFKKRYQIYALNHDTSMTDVFIKSFDLLEKTNP